MTVWKQRLATLEGQMKWGVLFAIVLAFLSALRDNAFMTEPQPLYMWIWMVASQLTLFMYWAAATPIVLHVMDRVRRKGFNRPRVIAIHAGLYGILGSIFYGYVAFTNVVFWPLAGATWKWRAFLKPKNFAALMLNSSLKYYLPLLLGGVLYSYYRSMREEELKATLLQEELAHSQFRLLKMQLHPHFLFNALNSISTLTYTDPSKADRMISLLSDLLRLSLEATDVVTVPLQEELQYVTKYLEIEQVRFSDRLETKFSIDHGALSADVPNLILQPLVENAIKHGISRLAGRGRIEVKAWKERGGLFISVDDNGPGFNRRGTDGGVGTRYIRQRLERLYGHRARFEMKNLLPRGARQELFIPLDDVSALYETHGVESGAVP